MPRAPHPAATSRPRRELGVRAALLLAGLLAALLVLEAGLQLASMWTRSGAGRASVGLAPGTRRILCVGDSNTWGLWVEPEDAYPQVLQRRWNARTDVAPIEVVNRGLPGTNSSRLQQELPGVLASLHPDVVLILVGANDAWTVPEDGLAAPGVVQRFLWRHSRLFRLVYLFAHSRRTPDATPAADGVDTGGRLPGRAEIRRSEATPGWTARLDMDLAAITADVARTGARPILLTYPADRDLYGDANDVIRRAAAETGVPLIDLAASFRPRCATLPCAELLPDLHPSREGYALVADVLVERLRDARLGAPADAGARRRLRCVGWAPGAR
jgi:lysophospholipase L1-like esterase